MGWLESGFMSNDHIWGVTALEDEVKPFYVAKTLKLKNGRNPA